jgi:hypothetical protein
MLVRAIRSIASVDLGARSEGDVFEVADVAAAKWIRVGYVEPAIPEVVETAQSRRGDRAERAVRVGR